MKKSIWKNDTVDFSLWAADYAKRYITLLQHDKARRFPYSWLGIKTNWYLSDPVSQQLVKEGSGKDLDLAMFFHYGFIKAGETITGQDLRNYSGAIPSNNLVFDFLMKNREISIPLINRKIPIKFDDYKFRSLATIGNPYGVNTYYYLIIYRNYNPVFKYEHFPLIWIVLHDPHRKVLRSIDFYISERDYYRNLFIDIPFEGPNSTNTTQWRSTSRCVWPENLNKHWQDDSEFSGMDFLMLYNLYRLIFR